MKNFLEKTLRQNVMIEEKFENWFEKYHNLEVEDINNYFTEEDKQIFRKLGIELKNKTYTGYECECLYMDFLTYYVDPENNFMEEEREFQKSLDGTGVTREEYNRVLKKVEKLNEKLML